MSITMSNMSGGSDGYEGGETTSTKKVFIATEEGVISAAEYYDQQVAALAEDSGIISDPNTKTFVATGTGNCSVLEQEFDTALKAMNQKYAEFIQSYEKYKPIAQEAIRLNVLHSRNEIHWGNEVDNATSKINALNSRKDRLEGERSKINVSQWLRGNRYEKINEAIQEIQKLIKIEEQRATFARQKIADSKAARDAALQAESQARAEANGLRDDTFTKYLKASAKRNELLFCYAKNPSEKKTQPEATNPLES